MVSYCGILPACLVQVLLDSPGLSSTQLCRSPGPAALELVSGASNTAGAGFLSSLARNANGIKKGPALHVLRKVLSRTERSVSEELRRWH
jgi:hypothetical protein